MSKDDENPAVLLKRIKIHVIVQNNHDVCDDLRSTMKMGTRVMTRDLVTSAAAGSTEFFPTKHFFSGRGEGRKPSLCSPHLDQEKQEKIDILVNHE